jgi:hypothetical protein
VAFFAPQAPYGGMAEQVLVRRGMWLPVPDGIDDVTAAAVTNPGMAAWKTLLWEGELAEAIAAEGPYDLIVDYLWGAPAEAAYDDLLRQVVAGEVSLDIDAEPLAKAEQVWPQAGSDQRVVFVP